MTLFGLNSAVAQPQINPCFSARPDTFPFDQSSRVMLAVRTSSTGALAPSGSGQADQFTFTFDSIGGQVLVSAVDSTVTLHVGASSTLSPSDFQVSKTSLNQVSIHYVSLTSKTFSAGETISVEATISPQAGVPFSAGLAYTTALHTATPATGDTLSFVDFPTGPPGPPGPAGTNQFTFTWSANVGQNYQLQSNTNLVSSDWINSGSAVTATNTTMSVNDPVKPAPQRFYRLEKLP